MTTLPRDLAWQAAYSSEFGTAPVTFAELYYDATSLLIRDLQNVSSIDGNGSLGHQPPASRLNNLVRNYS